MPKIFFITRVHFGIHFISGLVSVLITSGLMRWCVQEMRISFKTVSTAALDKMIVLIKMMLELDVKVNFLRILLRY